MHCFAHEDSPAVGTCQFCGRGVCKLCVPASPSVLACSEACAREAARLRTTIELSLQKGLRVSLVSAWFCGLSGAAFVVVGLLFARGGYSAFGLFPGLLGAIFLLAAYWYAKVSRQGV
jgi:hypothetical protein